MGAGEFGGAGQSSVYGGTGGGALGIPGGVDSGNVGVSGINGGNSLQFEGKELGMENGNIQDSQITSSTAWNGLPPEKGRLHGASSWSAGQNDEDQWIQIDLNKILTLTKIATQGRHNYDQWVKSYLVSYSSDGQTFQNYKNNGADKVRKIHNTIFYYLLHD